jgi:hypothetical protein
MQEGRTNSEVWSEGPLPHRQGPSEDPKFAAKPTKQILSIEFQTTI